MQKNTLKKQSDTSCGDQPLKEITFFLDDSLGSSVIAQRLIEEGKNLKKTTIKVELLKNQFPRNVADEVWLEFIGKKSFVALTKDRKIRWRKSEKIQVEKYNGRVFILTRGNFTGKEMAEIFGQSLRRMCNFIKKTPPPFIATVSKSGSITKFDLTTD